MHQVNYNSQDPSTLVKPFTVAFTNARFVPLIIKMEHLLQGTISELVKMFMQTLA